MKNFILTSLFLLTLLLTSFAESDNTITSTSKIDWTQNKFLSSIMLDIEKAKISMPAGKQTAVNKIDIELPILVKDPLLTIYINSNTQLADIVTNNDITLEQITNIIDTGKKTPGFFMNSSHILKTEHSINLTKISSLMIKHKFPYKNAKPIEQIPSRKYTGIIIDARGKLPVHGEFTKDNVYPCFFPEIWDENMNLIYEKNMGNPEIAKTEGIIHYDWHDDEKLYAQKIGPDPMRISARKVYGRFRTDPVISRNDALKILTVPENLELLKQGKVVILLDKENLIYSVATPKRDENYYAAYQKLKEHLFTDEKPPIIENTIRGIQILYDLKFVADSPELLQTEFTKIKNLANSLKKINEDNSFTILVEGHTADVNKPEGQMKLSIQRTQTIIKELVANGLDESIFTYRGYGGTQPIASNDTAEGRAQNRRVIITAQPKATYIQRK